jgi:hypothetical protein
MATELWPRKYSPGDFEGAGILGYNGQTQRNDDAEGEQHGVIYTALGALLGVAEVSLQYGAPAMATPESAWDMHAPFTDAPRILDIGAFGLWAADAWRTNNGTGYYEGQLDSWGSGPVAQACDFGPGLGAGGDLSE